MLVTQIGWQKHTFIFIAYRLYYTISNTLTRASGMQYLKNCRYQSEQFFTSLSSCHLRMKKLRLASPNFYNPVFNFYISSLSYRAERVREKDCCRETERTIDCFLFWTHAKIEFLYLLSLLRNQLRASRYRSTRSPKSEQVEFRRQKVSRVCCLLVGRALTLAQL